MNWTNKSVWGVTALEENKWEYIEAMYEGTIHHCMGYIKQV